MEDKMTTHLQAKISSQNFAILSFVFFSDMTLFDEQSFEYQQSRISQDYTL